jgi:hypothetical protein
MASGDGGIIGPPQIFIQEKAQNAIVAWNGTEEVMILSVDLLGSASTKVLRVIPLPSNPIEVKEGSFESFTQLQEIVNEKLRETWNQLDGKRPGSIGGNYSTSIEITFQKTIGVHNITIVKILDVTNFSMWATDFAAVAGFTDIQFSPQFQIMVEEYIEDNISYFVFDIINVTEEDHSITPIIYRFTTGFLFYPLKITAASDVGETYAQVNVYCITKKHVKEEVFSNLSFYSNIHYHWYDSVTDEINFTEEELQKIDMDIYNLFKDDPVFMSYSYYGRYTELDGDIIVTHEDFSKPDIEITASNQLFLERGTKNIINVTVKNIGNTQLQLIMNIQEGLDWLRHAWYTIEPAWYITIAPGNQTNFEILFDIPNNVPLGDYNLSYVVSSSNYDFQEQKDIIMTIYEKTEG